RTAQRWEGLQEALRVRMPWLPRELPGRGGLDDLARVHDRDPVRDLQEQREVVRDEEDGEAELALDLPDLLQDLSLHDHVEGGRRLIEDDELWLERERHRDDHALAHPAGQLVGIRAETTSLEPDELEQVAGASERLAPRHASVGAHHVEELVADAHDLVQSVHRALEDHRDLVPAIATEAVLAHASDVLPAEQDAATGDSCWRPQDLHHRVRDRALSAPRLACETEDLALPDREIDTVDRTHALPRDVVLDDELPQLEHPRWPHESGLFDFGALPAKRRGLHDADHAPSTSGDRLRPNRRRSHEPAFSSRSARSRGLLTSSMPASRRTSPRTVKASAAPGKKNGHHWPRSTVEFVCAQYSVTPQLVLAWSPSPRNSRPASTRSAM